MCKNNIDVEMVEYVAENINDSLDLFIDLGINYNENLILQSGTATINRAHMPAGAGAEFCDRFVETLEDKGVTILTETCANKLITNNNEVVGVEAVTENGTLTVNAKSVIIATGGYGWNEELLKEYSPKAVGAFSSSAPGNAGDGLKMAMETGAPIYGVPNLIVNENGKRGGNESFDYPLIYNQWVEDGSKDFYFIFQGTAGETTDLENNVSDTTANLESAVEAGAAYKADSIEELANVSELTELTKTVNTFNEAITKGLDKEFVVILIL